MADSAHIMTQAAEHLRRGRLDQAKRLYEHLLQTHPDDPNVLHGLSLIAFHSNQYETAVQLIHRVVSAAPNTAQWHNTYGVCLAALNRLAEAVVAYRRALQLKPGYMEAYNNLALALHAQGRSKEAVDSLMQAIRLHPNAAVSFYHLANLLRDQGRDDEAVMHYQKAIHLNPDLVQAHVNLGALLQHKGRYAEAAACFQQAATLVPEAADVHYDLGTALKNCGQYDQAVASYRRAIRLNPDDAKAHNGLGVALKQAGRCQEAVAAYDRALQLKPNDADARWNRCLALLLQGDLACGWTHYQTCYEALQVRRYDVGCHTPLWNGRPFIGKRLYVRYQQGLGDNIQFIRYLPQVKALGGTVIYEAKPELIPLFKQMQSIDHLVEAAADGRPVKDHDYHICLMDLARIFHTTLDTVPRDVPYLYADPERITAWRQHVTATGLKVGLVWAGGSSHRNDRNRSCALTHFAPLAELPGVTLFGLQTGTGANEAEQAAIPVINLGRYFRDFADTAAVIEQLDLVISVDTAVLHLAGAMGRPVWALLPFAPDWRWLLNRRDSPWYPTMKLFRQTRPGQWPAVLESVAEQLDHYRRAQEGNPTESLIKGHEPHDSHNAHSRKRCTTP